MKLNPDDSYAHLSKGNFLFMEHKWIEALDSFDRAVSLAPDDPSLLDSYAQTLLDVGYHSQAEELARRAILLDPLVNMYRNTLGRSLRNQGEHEQAIDTLYKAILIDETLPFPYNNLIGIAAANGQLDEVVSIMSAARAAEAYLAPDPDALAAMMEAQENEASLRNLYGRFGFNFDMMISELLEDADSMIRVLENQWDGGYRPTPIVLTDFDLTLVINHPRWKEQVRRDGILGLWRERGFPSWCRPLGDDDFECEIPKRAATD